MTLRRCFLALILYLPPHLAQANVYCAAGQNESVFPVATSGDDGYAYRLDTKYPPVNGATQGSTDTLDWVERSLRPSGAQYLTTVILERWNTATQPDGSVWPTETTVVDAFVSERYSANGESTDSKNVVFEWYSWTPPITDSYWTNAVPSPGSSAYAATMTINPGSDYGTTELTHLSNVNLSGYTGIRVGIGDGTAPTSYNNQGIYMYDYGPGAIPPLLVLCWTEPTLMGTVTSTPIVTSTPGITNTATVTPVTANTPLIPVSTSTPPRTATPTPQEVTATETPAMEDGRYLPPNTWVRLDTVATQRFLPQAYTDCTRVGVLSHPVGRRASSIVYGGGIFYFGGGGGSNPGNDVELFDIAANTWTQQYQPECLPSCCATGRCAAGVAAGRLCSSDADCPGSTCGGGLCYTGPKSGQVCLYDSACAGGSCLTTTCSRGPAAGAVCYNQQDCSGNSCSACDAGCDPASGVGTAAVTPLGRPYVEHAYQQVAYNPDRRKFTAALTSGTWEWDPATAGWTRLTPEVPPSNSIGTTLLVFDPDIHTVLFFPTIDHQVFRFDYASSTWVVHGPMIPEQISWADIFGAYDSKEHKYLVSHGGGSGTMWVYDSQAGTWTQLQNVPADVLFCWSVAYDPVAGVFLLGKPDAATSVRLWSYRIATDTWTRLEVAAGPPVGPTGDSNLLVYDQIWKRFYFLNARSAGGGGQGGTLEGDVETWAYRIGGPVGPGDANYDGRVSAADLVGLAASNGPITSDTCGAVDVDRDGTIDARDLAGTIDALFERSVSLAD